MHEKFFIIDADTLEQTPEKLYGMAFDGKSFITDMAAFDESAYRDYSGAFIAVKRKGDSLHIYQDANGTYGIYLYEEGEYFAFSNSFILLFEYLYFQKKKKLSLNYDYACHLLSIPSCSIAYTSTLCREIRILPPTDEIEIGKSARGFVTKTCPENEAIDIYSGEALVRIDRWISKWASLIQNLQEQKLFTEVDVTGGMDSRVTLSLALAADVDRSKINFCSAEACPVKDDFLLAREIAGLCGFSLNSLKFSGKYTKLSLADTWNISMLTNLGTHHHPYFKPSVHSPSFFKITGQGGETIRNHWYFEPHALERMMMGGDVSQKNISLCGIRFLWNELQELNKRYAGDRANGYRTLVHHLYKEGRARYHFGRNIAAVHIVNYMALAPLLDGELRRINCLSRGNTDYDLLMAVILTRIDRRLVGIPFNNGKLFSADCVNRALEINKKRRLRLDIDTFAIPGSVGEYVPDKPGENHQETPQERLRRLVASAEVESVITQMFGKELHDAVVDGFRRADPRAEQAAFKVLAVASVARPGAPILM